MSNYESAEVSQTITSQGPESHQMGTSNPFQALKHNP